MRASPFFEHLLNLRGELPENSMYFESKENAHRALKESTGNDCGPDPDVWEWWGREHKMMLATEIQWLNEQRSKES